MKKKRTPLEGLRFRISVFKGLVCSVSSAFGLRVRVLSDGEEI